MKVPTILAACALAVLMLAGCTPAASLPAESASPTAQSVPERESGTLVVGGQALTVYPINGSDPYLLPYSESSEVFIDALAGLFEYEPTVSFVESGHCSPSFTRASWGAFEVRTGDIWLPANATVEVFTTTETVAGFTVTSSLGLGVGDEVAADYAVHPENLRFEGEYEGHSFAVLYFEFVNLGSGADPSTSSLDDGTFPSGGYLASTDGLVDTIAAPVVPLFSSSC